MFGADRLQAMLTAEQAQEIAEVLRHVEEQIPATSAARPNCSTTRR